MRVGTSSDWGQTRAFVLGGVISALLASPATAQEPDTPRVSVRDSAGIEIVENLQPLLQGSAAWSLAPEPVVEIGSVEGDERASLFRVLSAVLLSDGRMAVFDGGSQEIRIFSADGGYLSFVGGSGGGPGEFSMAMAFRVLPKDTLHVYDYQQRRLTVFGPSLALLRTVPLNPPNPGGGFSYLGRGPDGSFITRGGRNAMYLGQGTGLLRDSAWISQLDTAGEHVGEILRFESGENMVLKIDQHSVSSSVPFGRRTFTVWVEPRIVHGFSGAFEYEEYRLDGALRRIVRKRVDPVPVTPGDIDSHRDRILGAQKTDRGMRRRILEKMEFPPFHPLFEDLVPDRLGNIWIKNHTPREKVDPAVWSVFDVHGSWITDVEVPDGLKVTDIGADFLIGVWRDELGVEFVQRYHLSKSGVGDG